MTFVVRDTAKIISTIWKGSCCGLVGLRLQSHEFSKEPSLQWVMNAIDTNLSATTGECYRSLRQQLWAAVDEEIEMKECDIYSYNPDLGSDPFGEDGCQWSFNYFIYNKKLKRIVFFTCRAIKYLLISPINLQMLWLVLFLVRCMRLIRASEAILPWTRTTLINREKQIISAAMSSLKSWCLLETQTDTANHFRSIKFVLCSVLELNIFLKP